MSAAQHRIVVSPTSSVPSLPSLCEVITKVPSNAQNEVMSDTKTCTTAETASHRDAAPSVSFDSEQATLRSNGVAQPPPCDRIRAQPSFRVARVAASQAMPNGQAMPHGSMSSQLLDDIYDAIVKEVPAALVSHVHDEKTIAASNSISIDSPSDFSKGFADAVPSFILVDGCQQSVSLSADMLRNQAGRTDGAVVVVLLEHPEAVDFGLLVEKVPLLVASGADDVIMIPQDATNMHLSIAVSFAKAQSSREQRSKLHRQLHASRKQCHRLFWEIAHEILPDFPAFQPQLREIRQKRVGNRVLVRKLGQGAYGSVYKWEDDARQRSGAVKVLPKEGISSADQALEMATEMNMLQRLNHRNVVTYNGAVHGMQSVYLFMEMVGTKNLFQFIHAAEGARGLAWPRAEVTISEIAAGVAHCHKMSVAHCDLKPENIVMSETGCPKIIDFGEAVDLTEAVIPLRRPRGTMPFAAPEIMLRRADWDPAAADIWSFAVIIVEILGGNHAFIRLLGWEDKDLANVAQLKERAAELKTFFTDDERTANESALASVYGLCHDVPPFVIQVLGDMFEMMPEQRITAESIIECIHETHPSNF